MKQTVRHGLGIALSAMVFVCNYSPWVRNAAALPDALTLSSGQRLVVQTGLPMRVASAGGAVSVLASQDERVTLSAEAGGQTSVTFSLLGLIPVHETRVNVVEARRLIPGGQAVGVALKTRGVLVVSDSAKGRLLRAGDVILSANGETVESAKTLGAVIGGAQSDTVRLEVMRGGQTITVETAASVDAADGRRKLGVWVRDSTAGVGTLTYVDPQTGAYGALGHAITDSDTGSLLPVREGALMQAEIVDVRRGQRGAPGELRGSFLREQVTLGTVQVNTALGIYGRLEAPAASALYPEGLPTASRGQVHTGAATILSTIAGQEACEYAIEITQVSRQSAAAPKSMVLRVTDERLLSSTGGIVQGMSGSPILQDGRIVGAVTHVFVSDPTQGYGVFIDWMLQQSDALSAQQSEAA